jgi:hypothetical protein
MNIKNKSKTMRNNDKIEQLFRSNFSFHDAEIRAIIHGFIPIRNMMNPKGQYIVIGRFSDFIPNGI